MRKLRVEPQDAENQQHKENVRLNNPRKKSLPRGKFEGHARSILEHKHHLRAVETRDGSAIQLPKQLLCGIHDQIDHLRIQRLFFGKRPGFSDRLFCQLRVAFAPLRKTSQKGHGILVDFSPKYFVDLLRKSADCDDGRSCAGMRARSHRSNIS